MDKEIDTLIGHMTKSHEQLARILSAKKDTCMHMTGQIDRIPDEWAMRDSMENTATLSAELISNLVSYLNGIGGLVEVMAEQLVFVMEGVREKQDE